MNKLLWGVVLVVAIIIGYIGFQRGWFTTQTVVDDVFCPLDAKICPDGTAVGRVAPECQFPACPGE